MKTKKNQEGYLFIDNRNNPGVSRNLICNSGLEAPVVGPNQVFESATITCSHCQRVVVLNPDRTRERAYCAKCDHYICDLCGAVGECVPFAKTLDLMEKKILAGD